MRELVQEPTQTQAPKDPAQHLPQESVTIGRLVADADLGAAATRVERLELLIKTTERIAIEIFGLRHE
jgi:hypothetical protein